MEVRLVEVNPLRRALNYLVVQKPYGHPMHLSSLTIRSPFPPIFPGFPVSQGCNDWKARTLLRNSIHARYCRDVTAWLHGRDTCPLLMGECPYLSAGVRGTLTPFHLMPRGFLHCLKRLLNS